MYSRAAVGVFLSTRFLYYLDEVHILWKNILLEVPYYFLGSWSSDL